MTGSCVFTWKNKTRNKRKRNREHKHQPVLQWVRKRRSDQERGKNRQALQWMVIFFFPSSFDLLKYFKSITCRTVWSIYCSYCELSLYLVIKRLICRDDFQCVLVCLQLCWNGVIISLCLCQWNTLFVSIHAVMCVTQMALGLRKLCPAKRAWSPNSSSILRAKWRVTRAGQTKRREVLCHWLAHWLIPCGSLYMLTIWIHTSWAGCIWRDARTGRELRFWSEGRQNYTGKKIAKTF